MGIRIFVSSQFLQFMHKEQISHRRLIEAINKINTGLIDVNYGGNVIKQRIPRTGEGVSSGYRSIIIYRKNDKAFFVYGFRKNSQDNISLAEKSDFKKLAKIMLTMTDQQIALLCKANKLIEVNNEQSL